MSRQLRELSRASMTRQRRRANWHYYSGKRDKDSMENWFRFVRNKQGNTGSNELWLLSDLGSDYDHGVTLEGFAKALRQLDGGPLLVLINSAGGDVFCAKAMAGLLHEYPGRVTSRILGLAASAAAFLALSADVVEMLPDAFLMIHEPYATASGTASDHRKLAGNLDQICHSILETYVRRTAPGAATRELIQSWMAQERWLDAPACKALGWADSIIEGQRYAAHAPIDTTRLRHYRNVPPQLLASAPVQTDLFSRLRLVNLNRGWS